MDKGKVFCRCAEGHCFLDKDAEWAKQNHAKVLRPNGILIDRALRDTLEDERLREKSEWMDSLRVKGTVQVCCRQKTEKLP